MEGFGRDIQGLILHRVANGHVSRLFHLFRVNRMFRYWVTRFVMNTSPKEKFHDKISAWSRVPIEDVESWDVLEQLTIEWKLRPSMLASLVMFLDARPSPPFPGIRDTRPVYVPKISKKALDFFEKRGRVLRDLSKKISTERKLEDLDRQIDQREARIAKYERLIEGNEDHLEAKREKRKEVESALSDLDKKYKKAK